VSALTEALTPPFPERFDMELENDSLRLRLADLPPDRLLKISAVSTLPLNPLLDYKLLVLRSPHTRDPPALERHLRTYRFLFALASRLHADLPNKAGFALRQTRLHGLGHKHKRCYTCSYSGALAGKPSRADWLGVYEIYTVLGIQLAGFLSRSKRREMIAWGVTKINFPGEGEWKEHPEVLNPPERAMVNIRASLLSVRHLLDADTDVEAIKDIEDFAGYVRKLVESKQGVHEDHTAHSGQSVHRRPLPEHLDSLVFHGHPTPSRRQALDDIVRLIRTDMPADQLAKRCEMVVRTEPNELDEGTYLVRRMIEGMKGLAREVALLANTVCTSTT
jgi:hypothetical protein